MSTRKKPSSLRKFFHFGLVCCLLSLTSLVLSRPCNAMDKKLKLLFKTSAYGAGAGFIIGAGTAAIGLGGVRNAFMGASAGLYAGILLAAYIIATPEDTSLNRFQQPYRPRMPIDTNAPSDSIEDYETGGELGHRLESHVEPAMLVMQPIESSNTLRQSVGLVLWMPLLTYEF